MHNHDDKYPARPGYEPGTSRWQAPVDTNEPSGLALQLVITGDDNVPTDSSYDAIILRSDINTPHEE